jgi:hypothetical protein
VGIFGRYYCFGYLFNSIFMFFVSFVLSVNDFSFLSMEEYETILNNWHSVLHMKSPSVGCVYSPTFI